MTDPAQRVSLGKTGLNVTRLSLGTAPIGNLHSVVTEDDSSGAINAALDDGINYVDTAPYYGYGLSETRTGQGLAGRNRDDLVISTKVGRLIREGKRAGSEVYDDDRPFYLANETMHCVLDYSYDGVMRSHEESLERLGLDRVDILHIHDPDDHFEEAVSGAYKALDALRSQGAISAVSAGMNQWQMESAFMDRGDFDCFLLAGRYSLLDQSALTEFLPKCEARGVAVIVGGVFNSGLLANPVKGATYDYVEAQEEMIDRALSLKAVCERYGVPLKAAAIRFPLGHPAVATVLSGVRSSAEWQENHRLFSIRIPADLWAELKAEGLLAEDAPVPSGE